MGRRGQSSAHFRVEDKCSKERWGGFLWVIFITTTQVSVDMKMILVSKLAPPSNAESRKEIII